MVEHEVQKIMWITRQQTRLSSGLSCLLNNEEVPRISLQSLQIHVPLEYHCPTERPKPSFLGSNQQTIDFCCWASTLRPELLDGAAPSF